jgi:hypothetical protein
MTYLFIIALCLTSGAGLYAVNRWFAAVLLAEKLTEEIAKSSTVNPWKSQLMLMLKSAQQVPAAPAITKGSILYGALVLEEVGETLMGLATGVEEISMGKGSELYDVSIAFVKIARAMQLQAITIRKQLAETSELPIVKMVSKDVAREILDGVTDIHVVVAGLGIACGLPGQAAYDRVATSNLSKANPVTGVIDKDAGGKWIKGPNYAAPDLDSLLEPYYGKPQA